METTIPQIKETLPDVKIKIAGKVYLGRVSGRNCEYPIVYVPDLANIGIEYTWQAIQHSINNGTPLLT